MAFDESRIKDKIYHGCSTRYASSERKLIDFEKRERCLLPTSEPFWKQSSDTYRMQTWNSTKKRQLIVRLLKYIKNLQD